MGNIACKHCGTEFVVSKEDREMMDKIAPVIGDKKYELPNPTLCPDLSPSEKINIS